MRAAAACGRRRARASSGMPFISTVWRRLDVPGHDSCRLSLMVDAWKLEGTAVFAHADGAACLHYVVLCDPEWRTLEGRVRGWVGTRAVDTRVRRRPDGSWLHDGAAIDGLAGCDTLDYGFTPATNLLQLRRARLAVGDAADVPAAWLDVSGGPLSRLEQRYRRVASHAYAYEAPSAGYAATLEIGDDGFVREYPGLWTREG